MLMFIDNLHEWPLIYKISDLLFQCVWGHTIKFDTLKGLSIKAFCFCVLSEFFCVGEAE